MKRYIVADAKGNILRFGLCPDKVFSLQADKTKGESVVKGIADDRIHKIVGGKVVKK